MATDLILAVYENGPEDRVLAGVLGVLAYYSRLDGSGCYPGIDRIARFCRVKRRIVIATLRKAERENWLEIVKKSRRDRRQSAYVLNIPRLLSNQREIGANDSTFPNKVQSTTFSDLTSMEGAKYGTQIGANDAEIGANDCTPLIRDVSRDVRRDVNPTPQAAPGDIPTTPNEKPNPAQRSLSDEIELRKSERLAKMLQTEEHIRNLARKKEKPNVPSRSATTATSTRSAPASIPA